MKYIIKQIRPCKEVWLVRMAGHGVWGAKERARTFRNRAGAMNCLGKLRAAPDGSMEIAILDAADSGTTVLANDPPLGVFATLVDDAARGCDLTLIAG